MEFSFDRELKQLEREWKALCIMEKPRGESRCICITGGRGTGKTKMAREYVRSHASAVYFSFRDMGSALALQEFGKTFFPDNEHPRNWEDAARGFIVARRGRHTLLIIDDIDFFEAGWEFRRAFLPAVQQIPYIEIALIQKGYYRDDDEVFVGCRPISEYAKLLPGWSKQDIVRIFAFTGGVTAVACEVDAALSLEENLEKLLEYDSAFSRFLPAWLGKYFRSPESYYPILSSIANGRHRLSRIARDVGFPNNKCGKYLEALQAAGLVEARKAPEDKQAAYYLANSYIAAWCRYIYGQCSLQIFAPARLLKNVMPDLDAGLCIPALKECCIRYIEGAMDEYGEPRAREVKNNIRYLWKDGSSIVLDYTVTKIFGTLVCVFPHTLDQRFKKEDLQHIYAAARKFSGSSDVEIAVFSVERFSDWCVHESSLNYNLHLVSAMHLKY
jgi:AAA+ ATPase superfamily predicted ATPase